jgi:hypothetical protein
VLTTADERRAQELGAPKGFFVNRRLVNGRPSFAVYSVDTGELFLESQSGEDVTDFLRAVPSIGGRRPRPTVETLAAEVAEGKGYRIGRIPSGGIAIMDPAVGGRAVCVEPFWVSALRAALRLPDNLLPPAA